MNLAADNDVTDSSMVQLRSRRESWQTTGQAQESMADVVFPVRRSGGVPRIMVRTHLSGPTRRFEFHKPFILQFEEQEFGIVAKHPALRCEGMGSTAIEAIEDFCESFEVQWEALVECPIEELTAGAIRVRKELRAIAHEVPME